MSGSMGSFAARARAYLQGPTGQPQDAVCFQDFTAPEGNTNRLWPPAGIKTVHFWAPVANWTIPVAVSMPISAAALCLLHLLVTCTDEAQEVCYHLAAGHL